MNQISKLFFHFFGLLAPRPLFISTPLIKLLQMSKEFAKKRNPRNLSWCIDFFWNPRNLVCASSLFQEEVGFQLQSFLFFKFHFFLKKPLHGGKVSSCVLAEVTIVTLNPRVVEKISK